MEGELQDVEVDFLKFVDAVRPFFCDTMQKHANACNRRKSSGSLAPCTILRMKEIPQGSERLCACKMTVAVRVREVCTVISTVRGPQ